MTLLSEAKATLINSAILEDRTEIRILKDRISQTVTILTTASFGVSAYVIGKAPLRFLFITDVGFLVLLWVAFWPLRRDLRSARRCLEFREEMLRKIGTPEEGPFNVYAVVPEAEPLRISEHSSDWLMLLATATLAAKMVVDAIGIFGRW